jgi:primosomal protein N''
MPSTYLDELKVALQKVEQTPEARREPEASELKDVLVDRIAALELDRAIKSVNAPEPLEVEIVYLPKKDDVGIN